MRRLALLCLFVACKMPTDTESPDDDGALDRIESTGPSTPDEGAAGPTAATDKKALPKVRDRDPEEEKKKMALSRQRSAEARKMLGQNRLTEAVDHARQALRIHEQNVDAMLVLAEVYYKQKKFELVHAVTSSALQVDAKILDPVEKSRVYNLKGFAYVAMGDENLATQSFRKAADADEKNASAWNNLGTRYMAAGDVPTAKSCFTYALELQPRFAKAHLNLGAALRAEGKWADAEKSLNAALKLKPNWAEAFFNLGVLYLDADPYPGLDTVGRLNKSIQFLTKYRELAVSDGPDGPGSDPTAGIARAGGKGTAKIAPGPAAVSKARAEDYIRVAKKGIEREERKAERERARGKSDAKADGGAKAGSEKAGSGKESGDAAGQADSASPKTPTTPPGASKPEPSKPEPIKPEPSKPDPSKPQSPGAAKPSTPSAPQTPGQTPATKPDASKPSAPAPTQPGGTPPAAPKPVAPTSKPAPSPAPTPPSAPPTTSPSAPKPQAPKPQAPSQTPKPQAPGASKSASLEPRMQAWNPRSRADTHRSGAMLGSTRMSLATRTHQRGPCDRACAPSPFPRIHDEDGRS